MPPRHVPPSIRATAFSCPHCGAYTTQYWFDLYAESRNKEDGAPFLATQEMLEQTKKDTHIPDEIRKDHIQWIENALYGLVMLEKPSDSKYGLRSVTNVNFSQCFDCNKVAVWVHDSLIYPPQKSGLEANADLPPDVLRDYEEAQSIVTLSLRGAAALLRLAIQKLCKHLGEKGEHLDADISSLVAKGLSSVVQKSLDIVRVIGNEAVHPGTIDLRDDRDTALQLFRLVNLIAEQMISNPKHVSSLYDSLPEAKRTAIEARDKKK